jgi:predicted nucleic acid-binding protein
MAFTALFDACVLYPAPVRDLLLRTAKTDIFRARWTDRIHDEWIRSLMEERPDLDGSALQRTRELMNAAVPDCLITAYEPFEAGLNLPDVDDRHVLAAAIVGRADVIVTYNLRDFPPEVLQPFGIEAQHPDEFMRHLFDFNTPAVLSAVRAQRAALKRPPQTARELLDTFLARGLVTLVSAIEPSIDLI